MKCGIIPSPTSCWALAVVATFHLSWSKSIKDQRQRNAATRAKEGLWLGGWIAPPSISAGEASFRPPYPPTASSNQGAGNLVSGAPGGGRNRGEICSGPAPAPRCWARPFCTGTAPGALHTSTLVSHRACTWMRRRESESSSNLLEVPGRMYWNSGLTQGSCSDSAFLL